MSFFFFFNSNIIFKEIKEFFLKKIYIYKIEKKGKVIMKKKFFFNPLFILTNIYSSNIYTFVDITKMKELICTYITHILYIYIYYRYIYCIYIIKITKNIYFLLN